MLSSVPEGCRKHRSPGTKLGAVGHPMLPSTRSLISGRIASRSGRTAAMSLASSLSTLSLNVRCPAWTRFRGFFVGAESTQACRSRFPQTQRHQPQWAVRYLQDDLPTHRHASVASADMPQPRHDWASFVRQCSIPGVWPGRACASGSRVRNSPRPGWAASRPCSQITAPREMVITGQPVISIPS
jgi:hypothetical protein